MKNHFINGNTIEKFENTESFTECKEKCQKIEKCVSFTWIITNNSCEIFGSINKTIPINSYQIRSITFSGFKNCTKHLQLLRDLVKYDTTHW